MNGNVSARVTIDINLKATCAFCGQWFSIEELSFDGIQYLCPQCNKNNVIRE